MCGPISDWREIDVTIVIIAAMSAIRKRTVMILGIITIVLLRMICLHLHVAACVRKVAHISRKKCGVPQ